MKKGPDDEISAGLGVEGKRGLLDKMRQASETSGRNRAARLSRQPAPQVRQVLRFDELPEYQRVHVQRMAGEMIGVANPFYRSHDKAAGATTEIGGREFIVEPEHGFRALGANSSISHPTTIWPPIRIRRRRNGQKRPSTVLAFRPRQAA